MKLPKYILIAASTSILGCATISSNNIANYEDSINSTARLSKEEQYILQESNKYSAELESKGMLLRDAKSQALLDNVRSRLLDENIANSIDIYILRHPSINAFALGNSTIYIHTGIFSILENEDQFAALLAHEIAHVTQRHNLKSIINSKNTIASAKILNLFTAGLASLPAIASLTQHSQKTESEADTVALQMMADAGYNITEMPALFENLKRVSGKTRETNGFFSTHPTSKKRVNDLNEQIAQLQTKNITKTNKNTINHYNFQEIRSDIMRKNIKMRLRSRQYQLALHDIDLLAKTNNLPIDDAYINFVQGESFFGISKYPEDAAKEKSIIEFGNSTTNTRQFLTEFKNNAEANRKKAYDHYIAAINADSNVIRAFKKLGEIAELDQKQEEAIKWYTHYRDKATKPHDKRYADRLIDRMIKKSQQPDDSGNK